MKDWKTTIFGSLAALATGVATSGTAGTKGIGLGRTGCNGFRRTIRLVRQGQASADTANALKVDVLASLHSASGPMRRLSRIENPYVKETLTSPDGTVRVIESSANSITGGTVEQIRSKR